MTPEQIDALPAGLKINALVAEHVMGWTREVLSEEFPDYSRDMNEAVRVMRKMELSTLHVRERGCSATIWETPPSQSDSGKLGDEALVICRAALKYAMARKGEK